MLMFCEWCESDNEDVSQQTIIEDIYTRKEITINLCIGCWKMHDEQLADALAS